MLPQARELGGGAHPSYVELPVFPADAKREAAPYDGCPQSLPTSRSI